MAKKKQVKLGKRILTRDNTALPVRYKAGGTPFQPGNNFWTKRSEQSRTYLFQTAEHFLEGAKAYFKHVDDNPEYIIEAKIEDGMVINHPVPKKRPYTAEGLCIWLGCSPSWIRNFKREQDGVERAQELLAAIAWAELVIYNQQYSGAVVGILNHSLVARKLKIAENINVDGESQSLPVVNVKIYNEAPPLADAEENVKLDK